MPSATQGCRACGRPANAEPWTRRQRRCQACRRLRLAPAAPEIVRPMAPVAAAVADALEACGWDGGADRIGGDVYLPGGGPTVGRVVIEVVPYTGLVVEGGQVARVPPAAFLQALKTSWNAPLPPPPPQPDAEPEPARADLGADFVALPRTDGLVDRRQFTRTPWPWEQQQ